MAVLPMSLPRRPRVVPGLDLLSLSISGRGKSADGEVVGSGERSSERRVDVIAGGGISPASSPASSLPSSSSSPDRDLGFAEAEGVLIFSSYIYLCFNGGAC